MRSASLRVSCNLSVSTLCFGSWFVCKCMLGYVSLLNCWPHKHSLSSLSIRNYSKLGCWCLRMTSNCSAVFLASLKYDNFNGNVFQTPKIHISFVAITFTVNACIYTTQNSNIVF